MPAPKKPSTKKKAAEAPKPAAEADAPKEEGAAAEPAKKAVRAKKPPAPMMPVHDPLPSVGTISVDEALKSAVGWSNSNNISKKFSVGTLTTAPYSEKVRVFQEMNSLAEEKSAVLPMSNFQSKH